jgi:hypothetical protein
LQLNLPHATLSSFADADDGSNMKAGEEQARTLSSFADADDVSSTKAGEAQSGTLSSFADADDGSSTKAGEAQTGTLSPFADADDGSSTKAGEAQAGKKNREHKMSEMAKAFHISPKMAMAISVTIAFAALTVPLAMRSLVCHGTFKMSVLAYLTLLSGFYMAWNIGANDVANAMGTSVGSGALTLRQAVLTAAVLEFSGAFLMGTHVTSTMQKGILVASAFQGKDSLLFAGLLSSLAAAGTWLQVCSITLLSSAVPIKSDHSVFSMSIRITELLRHHPVDLQPIIRKV